MTIIDRKYESELSLKHGGTGGNTVLIKPAALAVPLRSRDELVSARTFKNRLPFCRLSRICSASRGHRRCTDTYLGPLTT